MTSEGLGEMFEGDRAEGLARARSPIGVSRFLFGSHELLQTGKVGEVQCYT